MSHYIAISVAFGRLQMVGIRRIIPCLHIRKDNVKYSCMLYPLPAHEYKAMDVSLYLLLLWALSNNLAANRVWLNMSLHVKSSSYTSLQIISCFLRFT